MVPSPWLKILWRFSFNIRKGKNGVIVVGLGGFLPNSTIRTALVLPAFDIRNPVVVVPNVARENIHSS